MVTVTAFFRYPRIHCSWFRVWDNHAEVAGCRLHTPCIVGFTLASSRESRNGKASCIDDATLSLMLKTAMADCRTWSKHTRHISASASRCRQCKLA